VHGMKKEGEEAQATAMDADADMDVEKNEESEGALKTGQECLIGTQKPTNTKKKTNFAHQRLGTHNLKAGQEHALGTQVRMLFDDGVWYSGTVTKFDLRSKHYTVEFEDGDLQETKIPDKDVEVVQRQVHAASAGAGKAVKGERTSLSDAEGP
jgi:NACalpha-BTF3-like transcription factor